MSRPISRNPSAHRKGASIVDLAICQECGRSGSRHGVSLRERLDPGTYHVERRRLCARCGEREGFSLVNQMRTWPRQSVMGPGS